MWKGQLSKVEYRLVLSPKRKYTKRNGAPSKINIQSLKAQGISVKFSRAQGKQSKTLNESWLECWIIQTVGGGELTKQLSSTIRKWNGWAMAGQEKLCHISLWCVEIVRQQQSREALIESYFSPKYHKLSQHRWKPSLVYIDMLCPVGKLL